MRKYVFVLPLILFFTAVQVSGADLETRLRLLEETILKQQALIETQQSEINQLKKQAEPARTAQQAAVPEKKDLAAQPAEATAPTRLEPADRAYLLKKKYDDPLKPWGVYSAPAGKFVPDISLIVDGAYVNRNLDDEKSKSLEIPEFIHSPAEEAGHGHSHGMMNQQNGFNLNYAELSMFAAVDPYFDLTATLPFSSDGVELEEAFFTTRSLPWGFQLKGGKFRSSIGRLNVQHPHVWDFADAPLVNRAFFGNDGLVEVGAQVNWLAPTPFYLLLGAEWLQGDNEASFGTSSLALSKGDYAWSVGETQKPNLFTAFLKSSVDFGNLSLLGGLSYIQGDTRLDHTGGDRPHGAYGATRIYGADFTAKYFIDSYRYLSWQNEYFFRHQDLTVGLDADPANPAQDFTIFSKDKKQSGLYSQLVFKFAPRWRIGARYDLLNQSDITVGGAAQPQPGGLDRWSAMLEFKPSEFSAFRLQFNHNNALFTEGGQREPVNEIFLGFTMAIGAHGAHSY